VLLGHARESGGEVRTGGRDAHRHGHAAAHFLDHAFHHPPALLVREAMGLPGDAKNGDAGDTGGEGGLHETRHARRVEVAAIRERRRHDVKNPRPVNHQMSLTMSGLIRF